MPLTHADLGWQLLEFGSWGISQYIISCRNAVSEQ